MYNATEPLLRNYSSCILRSVTVMFKASSFQFSAFGHSFSLGRLW